MVKNLTLLDRQNITYIPDGTWLTITIEGQELAQKSVFVGLKDEEYMVVTAPVDDADGETPPPVGSTIGIKYIFHGQVYAFQTEVLNYTTDPIDLWTLALPESITKYEMRDYQRITCFIPAQIKQDQAQHEGVIKDISKKGCRCILKVFKGQGNQLHLEDQIELSCFFPGIADKQQTTGVIKDINTKPDGIDIGIEFDEIVWWVPPYE